MMILLLDKPASICAIRARSPSRARERIDWLRHRRRKSFRLPMAFSVHAPLPSHRCLPCEYKMRWGLPLLPAEVIATSKHDEEAKDGEEDDSISCHHQTTGTPLDLVCFLLDPLPASSIGSFSVVSISDKMKHPLIEKVAEELWPKFYLSKAALVGMLRAKPLTPVCWKYGMQKMLSAMTATESDGCNRECCPLTSVHGIKPYLDVVLSRQKLLQGREVEDVPKQLDVKDGVALSGERVDLPEAKPKLSCGTEIEREREREREKKEKENHRQLVKRVVEDVKLLEDVIYLSLRPLHELPQALAQLEEAVGHKTHIIQSGKSGPVAAVPREDRELPQRLVVRRREGMRGRREERRGDDFNGQTR
ncbi:hypothetical protein INR49_000276 [Caranx melampygus]|nr:hypothetical protein INR49_000276 [Caranx melampygus]